MEHFLSPQSTSRHQLTLRTPVPCRRDFRLHAGDGSGGLGVTADVDMDLLSSAIQSQTPHPESAVVKDADIGIGSAVITGVSD